MLNTIWVWSWSTQLYPDTPARRLRKRIMYGSKGFAATYWAILMLIYLGVWFIWTALRWLGTLI